MRGSPLSWIAVWVLIAVSKEPSHLYGMAGRVYGYSLAYVLLDRVTIRTALRSLVAKGLVEEVGTELGKRSGNRRKLYFITEAGLRALKKERIRLRFAFDGIDRALAARVISSGVSPRGD